MWNRFCTWCRPPLAKPERNRPYHYITPRNRNWLPWWGLSLLLVCSLNAASIKWSVSEASGTAWLIQGTDTAATIAAIQAGTLCGGVDVVYGQAFGKLNVPANHSVYVYLAIVDEDRYYISEVRRGRAGDTFRFTGPYTYLTIPEPASAMLMAIGAAVVCLRRRRRNG